MTTRPILPLPPPPARVCAPCHRGCNFRDGDPGCGHYGCRGAAPLSCAEANQRRAAYEERLAATRRQRAVLARRRARWSSAADSILLANLLP